MATIQNITSREILDSRGNPTLETSVLLSDGTVGVASVPSGASTGTFEAIELRDGDSARYQGQGVLKAISHVEGEIRNILLGMDAGEQEAIDKAMLELDGTDNKGRLGANAILSVSLAVCRAQALSLGIPLHQYIRTLAGVEQLKSFPVPLFNIINGGKHSNSGLSVQEFKLVPTGIETYPEQLRAGSEVFHSLERILAKENFATSVGDEGGFAPRVESHKRQLELLHEAITAAGYVPGKDIFLDLDVAADSFYDTEKDQYHLRPENVFLTRESMINLYREWIEDFHIVSIEDGLHEEDWDGWVIMKEKLERENAAWGKKMLLVGDDLLVTNITRLEKAIATGACNSVLIKVNQIGSLSETLACMKRASEVGMARIVSHRSGETTDDFIADLAVGTNAEYIKTGSLSRGERIVKYNRLLAIWNEFNTKA
jgi:enolase